MLTGMEIEAQTLKPSPRLVVNITIDQLRTDYMEQFAPLYSADGFQKLLSQGSVYEAAHYPFSPVDRASAIAAISTGTSPEYNNIVANQWLDRATLRPVVCVDDEKYGVSPQKLSTSTIGDELKVATNGAAIVCSIALEKDAAVLSAGHAADGAFWISDRNKRWTTSSYYSSLAQNLIRAYNSNNSYGVGNDAVYDLSLACVNNLSMGNDDVTDLLSITFSANIDKNVRSQSDAAVLYVKLDNLLADLVKNIETKVGGDRVLFVLTSTGYTDDTTVDYERYRIPTGTFYINRTANLLNMYLGAIYGQGRYVETCFGNQIYLNRKFIEQRCLSYSDVILRSKELLVQTAGVRGVSTSPYNPSVSGDLVIEVAPGWQLLNEENQQQFTSRAAFVPFPIIIYGADVKPQRISTAVTIDRIAPTIAKAIRIRAPNACSVAPLQ